MCETFIRLRALSLLTARWKTEVSKCTQIDRSFQILLNFSHLTCAPVAQLDRALASGAKGRAFESRRAYHFFSGSSPRASGLS